jgi:hypothetical protein
MAGRAVLVGVAWISGQEPFDEHCQVGLAAVTELHDGKPGRRMWYEYVEKAVPMVASE